MSACLRQSYRRALAAEAPFTEHSWLSGSVEEILYRSGMEKQPKEKVCLGWHFCRPADVRADELGPKTLSPSLGAQENSFS